MCLHAGNFLKIKILYMKSKSLKQNDFHHIRFVANPQSPFYSPNHPLAKDMGFPIEDDKIEQAVHEANLADAIAYVAADNGLNGNDVHHILPLVLRMLKSKSIWIR